MISDNQVLFQEAMHLASTGAKPVFWNYRLDIIVDGETRVLDNVISIDTLADFISSKTVSIIVTVDMQPSLYNLFIIPNKNKLRARITKIPTNSMGVTAKTAPADTTMYIAAITDGTSPSLVSTTKHSGGGSNLDDVGGMVSVDFELMDENYYRYRMMETMGVYYDITSSDLLRGLMTAEIPSSSGTSVISVDIVPGDNTQVRPETVVRMNKLTDIPWYLQKKCGVYSSGMGYFYLKNMWYIYPIADFNRFYKSVRKAIIVMLPTDEVPLLENSYYLDGTVLYIFSTGDVEHKDYSEHSMNSRGNAFMYANERNLLDRFRVADAATTAIPKGTNLKRIYAEDRLNNFKMFTTRDKHLHNNPWELMSELAIGTVASMKLTWENSDPEMIFPGMPVKILHKNKGEIHSLYGTLNGMTSNVGKKSGSPTDARYISKTELSLVIQRLSND